MTRKTIGFVGGGRVARIMLAGSAKIGQMPAEVVVSDSDASALERLAGLCPDIRAVGSDNPQAAHQDIVLLAVHPPHLAAALDEIKPSLQRDAILVSLAPKWTVAKLAESLNGFTRIARMIPNAPSVVGQGYNPIAYSASLTEQDRSDVAGVFSGLGELPEVAEEKLEIYAILTAMGPTYLWPQLYELQGLAQSFGLSEQEASSGLAAMVNGAVATMIESGLGPEEVQDLIPVKPLADMQSAVLEAYRTKLNAVLEKIRPDTC